MVSSVFSETTVAECRSCSLSFLNPLPDERAMRPLYEKDYFDAYRDAGQALPAESLSARFRQRLLRVQKVREPGRVLEIGFGHASFLRFAREQGWDCFGIDVSDYAVRSAREQFGLNVMHGTLDDIDLPENSFDLVHMSHVLEHVAKPVRDLAKVRRLLKPGGIVIIEVPNEFENLLGRLSRLIGLRRRAYEVPSTHVFFFTPASLQALIVHAGLKLWRLTTYRDTADPRLARRALKLGVSFLERPLRLGPLIEAMATRPAGDAA